MGVYRRADSPFYWMSLERPGRRPLQESSKIPVEGGTPGQTRLNRQLALEAYAARMADLARARYDLPGGLPLTLFREYRAWYLEHVSTKKRNLAREASMLRQLGAFFDPMPLGTLTRAAAQEWLTARLKAVKPATARREFELLRHVLTTAIPKYLTQHPLAGFRKGQLRIVSPEPRILTREEEQRILAVVDNEDRALLICAIDTLMRLSDVVGLTRDADRGRHLIVMDPKVERYRVPVSRRLRQALDALDIGAGAYYFPKHHQGRGAQSAKQSVMRMFQEACAAAQVTHGRRRDGVTFHSLRHTGASRALEAGADIRTVQQLGGWRNLTQLVRYTHPTDEARQRAVDAIGEPPQDAPARPPAGPRGGDRAPKLASASRKRKSVTGVPARALKRRRGLRRSA